MTDTTKTEALDRLEKAVARKAVLFLTYMGKAMPDEVYSEFATLRDDTIPALRQELSEVEAERDRLRAALAASCDEERNQIWEAGPGGGCMRALEAESERDRLRKQVESINATADALRETLHDELDGNLRLREIGGARPDEPMTTFLERVFSERDRLAAECEALRADAERYRWLAEKLGETQLPTLIERITQGYVADYKPSIDAAIDAAMGGKESQGARSSGQEGRS